MNKKSDEMRMSKQQIFEDEIDYRTRHKMCSDPVYGPCFVDKCGDNFDPIGRALDWTAVKSVVDYKYGGHLATLVKDLKADHHDDIMQEEYRGHDIEFWNAIQELHDEGIINDIAKRDFIPIDHKLKMFMWGFRVTVPRKYFKK